MMETPAILSSKCEKRNIISRHYPKHIFSEILCFQWVCWGLTLYSSVWCWGLCIFASLYPVVQAVWLNPEEIIIEKDTCTPVFIAALFTVATTREQPGYPSTDEWIKKLWCLDTVEYYSAIKRDAPGSVLMRRMNLEPIIQSEVSQKEKDKYHILTHIWNIEKW